MEVLQGQWIGAYDVNLDEYILPTLAKDFAPYADVWRKKHHVFCFVVALYCNTRKYFWIVYTYVEPI